APAVETDLGKAHRPRDPWNAAGAAEVRRPHVEDRSGRLERLPTVLRPRERDVEPFVPHQVLRPVRGHRPDDPDDGAVVVTRKPRLRADALRRRPGPPPIPRAAE